MKHGVLSTTLLLPAMLAASAAATTYVEMSDAALAGQAEIVAEVYVLSADATPARGVPSTDYVVQVERLLKGTIAGTTIVVRVAGGVGTDGRALRIEGAPRFSPGETLLLFLAPRHDGTYGILHMTLGAFHRVSIGKRLLAVRELDGAHALGRVRSSPRPAPPYRDFDRFADWLAGVRGSAPYDSTLVPGAHPAAERAALPMRRGHETALRSSGEVILWRAGPPDRIDRGRLVQQALQAWTRRISRPLVYGGFTDAGAGLTRFDGLNVVAFDDADEVISGAFSCSQGGIVAAGGPWFDPEDTRRVAISGHDQVLARILGGDVVFNDGTDCLLDSLPELSRETLIHELGLTLGAAVRCGQSQGIGFRDPVPPRATDCSVIDDPRP